MLLDISVLERPQTRSGEKSHFSVSFTQALAAPLLVEEVQAPAPLHPSLGYGQALNPHLSSLLFS